MATTVRLHTSQGIIDVALYDQEAPQTVANFLAYLNSRAYDDSFFHRSVPGFVIQGGGYVWDDTASGPQAIVTNPPVVNEFAPTRSNTRGTIAMAKLSGDPDSATSQWFINLADNSANLDSQNGGFTVFGLVIGSGMAVVDAIAALPTGNAGGAFAALPLSETPSDGVVRRENLVVVETVTVLSEASASDRLFNYLEAAYPQYLSPSPSSQSATAAGYYYRHYPAASSFLATSSGSLYYLGPLSGDTVVGLGTLDDWLASAAGAGY
ncbi:MAG: peptidylprolyl isomerase [Thermodesulfobacteriota bacterium]